MSKMTSLIIRLIASFAINLVMISVCAAAGTVLAHGPEQAEPSHKVIGRNPPLPPYTYQYNDPVEHRIQDDVAQIGFIYVLSIGAYLGSQPRTVFENGSYSKYRRNFGRTVHFDNDKPFWNWFIHPISGSQLYLYYRANSYSPADAFRMTFISSLLFEYTIEVYSEPASMEDILNTPILGAALGAVIEHQSLLWINSGNRYLKWLGHFINPVTLLSFMKQDITVTPGIAPGQGASLNLNWRF